MLLVPRSFSSANWHNIKHTEEVQKSVIVCGGGRWWGGGKWGKWQYNLTWMRMIVIVVALIPLEAWSMPQQRQETMALRRAMRITMKVSVTQHTVERSSSPRKRKPSSSSSPSSFMSNSVSVRPAGGRGV